MDGAADVDVPDVDRRRADERFAGGGGGGVAVADFLPDILGPVFDMAPTSWTSWA